MPTHDVTTISSIGLSFIIVMGILVFLLPQRLALIPVLITAIYITLGQQLLISVFHFSALRIVILFAWIRLIIRRESFAFKLNTVDKAMIWWVISSTVIYDLHWQTPEAFVNRLGFTFDAIGMYFLFRSSIRDVADIEMLFRSLAVIIIPLTVAMLYEYSTGRNIFAIFGGVPEITMLRDGRFRCQGAFRQPILAGTFGATLLPVYLALWFKGETFRKYAIAGIVSTTIVMVTSSSSGPLLTSIFGVAGLSMWSFRRNMRAIRWGVFIALVSLQLVMKAPVWYLISRISEIFGGGGWHRSYLIDQALAHFGQWWLSGMSYTADWFPYGLAIDPTKTDITNHYIQQGIDGGLLTLILFIAIIVCCFKAIGRSLKAMEESTFAEKIIVWSLGASLFAHVISFTSVSYFDQIILFWYLLLAMISVTGDSFGVLNDVKESETVGDPLWES